jgi:4-carboxymuconolactone decarboxylase
VTLPFRSPRIPPRTNLDPESDDLLRKVMHFNGVPLNEPRTLAWHPKLLKRFTVFAGMFLSHSALPTRDREILTLRSTYRAGCEYLFGHHQLSAPDAGISSEELHGIVSDDFDWSPRDRLLLTVADELTTATSLSDSTWEALADIYDKPQLLEALMLVGFYRMVCASIVTLQIELEPGLPRWPSAPSPQEGMKKSDD